MSQRGTVRTTNVPEPWVVEEGLACQTLFNPSYFGFDLLREAYIPALGIGVWWTHLVRTLRTVLSISMSIAISTHSTGNGMSCLERPCAICSK
jgi:hypothetical protein